jgi:hypothetical protein
MTSPRHTWHRLISSSILASMTIVACGCTTAVAQRDTDAVVVAPVDGDADNSGMTEAELEDQLRRYADRFYTRIVLATNTVANETSTSAEELLMHQWKSVSVTTIVELAIGPNAVTNLLDMIVLTTLTRQTLEGYWIPEVFGEQGQPLLDAYLILEEDISTIADRVLTPEQQDDLTSLLADWSRDNPEQIYPWYVRLNEFSGQRAASLQDAQRSGGLLSTVRQTREAVEEVQAFGERILFYLHRAPAIASYAMQGSVLELLQGPEVSGVLRDTDRFTASVEELVDVIAQFPYDRVEAIDQLMEQVAAERSAFFDDLERMGPDSHAIVTELRQSFEVFERVLILLNVNSQPVDGKQFDIANFEAFASEAAASATEIRQLVESVESLVSSPEWVNRESMRFAVLDQFIEAEASVINRSFTLTALLILFFFATLLGYKYLATRLSSN